MYARACQRNMMPKLLDIISNPGVKCGWGMDYVWAWQLHYRDIGIVDAVAVVHTRPQAGLDVALASSAFYKTYRICPVSELHDTMQRYGIRKRTEHKVQTMHGPK